MFKSKTSFARELRSNQTKTEKLLWFHLRNRKLAGFKFHRQFVIDKYIVDFVCLEKMLIIELDGGQHNSSENFLKDSVRTAHLEKRGYKIIRFWDTDVFNHIETVLEMIYSKLCTSS